MTFFAPLPPLSRKLFVPPTPPSASVATNSHCYFRKLIPRRPTVLAVVLAWSSRKFFALSNLQFPSAWTTESPPSRNTATPPLNSFASPTNPSILQNHLPTTNQP